MSSPKTPSKIMSRGMSTQKLSTGPTRKGVSFPNCQVSWKKMPEAQLAELLRRDFKTLAVHLKKATALAAKDKSGHSDPYCVLSIGNRKLNSSVIKKTLNPVWDELFDFEVFDDDKKLTITCWDKDLFGKDFEGSCVIDFSTLVTGKATDMTIELIGTGTGALHLTLTLYNCGVEPTPEPAPVSPTTPTASLKREPSSASPVRNPKRERYVRLDRIGDGGQASVFKVKDQQDGTEKVMKQIICESADQATVALGEVWQVRDLKQDNIVSYEDLYLDEMDIVGTKKYLVCFIMPFFKNGDLMGYIKRRAKPQQKKYVPKDKVVTYITQLARGLEFIHKNHVMHRDIKPQNILCNDDYSSVAFCDFGLAKKAVHDVASTICGTGGYMSPEQIKGADDLERLKYTNAVDIFALGVVMYELMTLRIGVMHGDLIVAREDVHLANLKQELTMIYKDEKLADIVVSMLRLDPNKRPTATELIEKLSSL